MNRNLRGFTIVELMITLLMLGVLAALAVPSFRDMIEKTKVRTATESLVEVFRVARLTAVQERTSVTLCPLGADSSCNGTNWDNGVLVLKHLPNDTEEVIQKLKFDDSLYIWKNNLDTYTGDNIVINFNGWAPAEMSSIFICTEQGNIRNGYRVVISMAGKIRTEPLSSADQCGSES